MSVTIVDTRTLVDHADAVGSWVSPVRGEAITLFTADPTPVEATGCLGIVVSIETSDILFPITAANLSNTLIYVWVLANGTMDTRANGGIAVILRDATPDEVGYHVAGSDVAAFRHAQGPVGWQCLLIDTGNLPSQTTVLAGTLGGLDVTVINGIGAMYKTLSKALGGASNCFVDTIRYGNSGLIIAGGTTGARGTFSEIAIEDRSQANLTAYGICRELGAGLFSLQGGLTFGRASATAEHWFQDTNVVVVFENRSLVSGRYFFNLAANSTDVGHFQLGLINGSDGGKDGCSIIVPPGVGANMDFSDPDFDFVGLYASSFTGFSGGILFCDDATNGITHDVFACAFTLCGTIDPGRVDMKNCSIVNSSATSAMKLTDSDNTLMAGISFQSDGTGHAIELTHTGAGPHTINFAGHKYSGYASIDGSTGNEVVLYNPGTLSANMTINVTSSGDTPTIMKAAGVTGTVTVNNNKTVTFTGMKDNTEVRIFKTSDDSVVDGIENATAGSADNRSFAWSAAASLNVYYRIFHGGTPAADGKFYENIEVRGFVVPTSDASIPIQQRVDRNYSNP